MQVEYRILGSLEVSVDGRAVALGGRHQRALLALLLAQVNEVVPVDRLIDGLWDEAPPDTAANIVRYTVPMPPRPSSRSMRYPATSVPTARCPIVIALFVRALPVSSAGASGLSPRAAASSRGVAQQVGRCAALADAFREERPRSSVTLPM